MNGHLTFLNRFGNLAGFLRPDVVRRSPRGEVSIRPANFDRADLEGIQSVCRQSFEMYRTCSWEEFYELWSHKWMLNPARAEVHKFGWVLEDSHVGIVGYIGIVPIRMKVGSQEIVGGTPHTWAVSRAYATYGLNLYKQALIWGDRHFLVATTAGKATSTINAKLGMGLTRIPVKDFNQRLLWLIKPEIPVTWMLQRSAQRRGVALVTQAPWSWLLMAAVRTRFVAHRRLRFPGTRMPVAAVADVSDEFTELWNRCKAQYGITTVRDRAFLHWRHRQVPAFLKTTHHLFACRDQGRLQGYLVLLESGLGSGCPGHFRVGDVFYDKSRPEVVGSLMNYAFDYAKAHGGSLFDVSHFSQELVSLLRQRRPYVRQPEAWPYWYKAPTEEIAEICRREAWWPSAVDGDSQL